MKKFTKGIIIFSLLISFNLTFAEGALPKNSPERQQLMAMGYEFDKEETGDTVSIVSNGNNKLVLSQNSERL